MNMFVIPVGICRMSWICLKGHNTRVVTLVIWEAGDSWHCGLKKKKLHREARRERRASALTAVLFCAVQKGMQLTAKMGQLWHWMEWSGIFIFLLGKYVKMKKYLFHLSGKCSTHSCIFFTPWKKHSHSLNITATWNKIPYSTKLDSIREIMGTLGNGFYPS